MKREFRYSVVCAIAIVLAACSSPAPTVQVAPPLVATVSAKIDSATATAVAAAASPATATAVRTATAASTATAAATATAVATAAPTKPPVTATRSTLAPTTSPTASGSSVTAAQAMSAAFAKTKKASALAMDTQLTGRGALVEQFPDATANEPFTVFRITGTVKGNDYQFDLGGLLAFGADDLSKGQKVIQAGGKTYVHGPAAMMNAPTDDWYELDSSSGMSLSFSLSEMLDDIGSANGDWTSFRKSRAGEALDGRKCDTFEADKDSAANTLFKGMPFFTGSADALTADSGKTEVVICDDGYLHGFTVQLTLKEKANSTRSTSAAFQMRLSEFDSPTIFISAPAIVKKASGSSSSSGTLPTPTAASRPTASATSGYDGEWEGTTSEGTDISFSISKNQFEYVNLSYSTQSGNCFISGSVSTAPDQKSITGNAFAIQYTSGQDYQFAFNGTFTSNTQANGTLQVKGTSTTCGAFDSKVTWTAQNGGVP